MKLAILGASGSVGREIVTNWWLGTRPTRSVLNP